MLDSHDQLLISGGNRSGKTAFASWYVVQLLAGKAGARVACFSMTHQSSIRDQQPSVYEMLPKEFKKMKRGQVYAESSNTKRDVSIIVKTVNGVVHIVRMMPLTKVFVFIRKIIVMIQFC